MTYNTLPHTRQLNESTSQKVGTDPDLAPEYQLGCARNAAVENKLYVQAFCETKQYPASALTLPTSGNVKVDVPSTLV